MEGFCRGCLIKYDEPMELVQYSEKNRRLFMYSTGLQAKRNDSFTFQLCKDCYLNMKTACKFKKQCRSSDKKLKNFVAMKNNGDDVDFCNFLKNSDHPFTFRFPTMTGNNTPATQGDDDNESVCTSIRNFMTDILQGEEVPDAEARIIREVIEEEADVLDDSLDSQWLQDDVSIDTDFRLDFNFSPFSTPRSIENDHCYTPKKSPVQKDQLNINYYANNKIMDQQKENIEENDKEIDFFGYNNGDIKSNVIIDNNYIDEIQNDLLYDINSENCKDDLNVNINVDANLDYQVNDGNKTKENKHVEVNNILIENNSQNNATKQEKVLGQFYLPGDITKKNIALDNNDVQNGAKDNIDKNLEQALKNELNTEFSLEGLLASPTVLPRLSTPVTPIINNILFGDKIDLESQSNGSDHKTGQCIEKYENVEGNIEILEEFFNMKNSNFNLDDENSMIDANKNTDVAKSMNELFDLENCFCKECKKKFKDMKALRIHSRKIHRYTIKNPNKDDHRYKRRICDKCGKEFNDMARFCRHKKQHANENKIYRCDQCMLTFTSQRTKDMHMVTHTGITTEKVSKKKYVCNICGVTINSYSNLRLHMKRHAKTYTLKCEDCGKGFFRRYDLTIHMRTHTGDQPFKCGFCERSFSRRTTLISHIQTHTGPGYVCDYCHTKFAMKRYIVRHLMKSKKCYEIRDRRLKTEKSKGTDASIKGPKDTTDEEISTNKKTPKKRLVNRD
ncbi:zinc finger protein 677 isoform X1 [Bombyx mori]|uniref:Uncharacterized protein n=1 Tax=Bombyx mori TaxID=7091 RepID=A0A8R2M3L3_BOMMO|nr:zinc finger protein 677 isoform X1 [Bombyx mori]XP_021204973.1 zinc finger protein 677 isoform X1 [Bombyx mori]XP_021204974.1 zinc finger protein 677 isoform X1 [Bombyx mori]XP_037873136.1 zinc finger protein 677 isoform X1 [Bombyx mori]